MMVVMMMMMTMMPQCCSATLPLQLCSRTVESRWTRTCEAESVAGTVAVLLVVVFTQNLWLKHHIWSAPPSATFKIRLPPLPLQYTPLEQKKKSISVWLWEIDAQFMSADGESNKILLIRHLATPLKMREACDISRGCRLPAALPSFPREDSLPAVSVRGSLSSAWMQNRLVIDQVNRVSQVGRR